MTEAEWPASTYPHGMLAHLGQPSERKVRLFAVACCRRVSARIDHPDSAAAVEAVEVAERYADGGASAGGLRDARAAADAYFTQTCVYGTSTGDPAARAAVAAAEPWESFQYSYIGVRSVYEPTRFEVEFVGYDERYKVVVVGRNLGRIYAPVTPSRMEWLRADPRGEFAEDGQPVITKIEAVKVEEKKR